jgi:hypothetical protein
MDAISRILETSGDGCCVNRFMYLIIIRKDKSVEVAIGCHMVSQPH